MNDIAQLTDAIQHLTREVRLLREDLRPELKKSNVMMMNAERRKEILAAAGRAVDQGDWWDTVTKMMSFEEVVELADSYNGVHPRTKKPKSRSHLESIALKELIFIRFGRVKAPDDWRKNKKKIIKSYQQAAVPFQ